LKRHAAARALQWATPLTPREALQTAAFSFNHLVGALLEMERYVEAKRFRRLEVDGELNLTGIWIGSSLGLAPLRTRSAYVAARWKLSRRSLP
jgi:hypothetical protein